MEIFYAYFWIIKLLVVGATLGFMFLSFREQRKTGKVFNKWFFVFSLLIFLQFFTNVLKFDGTNTKNVIKTQNVNIELLKELPVKVEDNSFSKEVNENIRITKEDLK